MARPFEVVVEQEVEATPEEVFEAVSTGPGLDAWFMGVSEIEPRLGGAARTSLPGFTMESTVTAFDPPTRFITESPQAEDGRLMTFAFIIEGRGGGTTLVRLVHSGFLPDDEWEQEFDALKIGDPAYVQKLAQYLKYFRGRTAVPVSAFRPDVDGDRAWAVIKRSLGLGETVSEGDPVKVAPEGLAPIDGVVDYVSSDFIGVRTQDALLRFIYGLGGTVVLGHHIFANVDQQATEQAWQSWLDRSFA